MLVSQEISPWDWILLGDLPLFYFKRNVSSETKILFHLQNTCFVRISSTSNNHLKIQNINETNHNKTQKPKQTNHPSKANRLNTKPNKPTNIIIGSFGVFCGTFGSHGDEKNDASLHPMESELAKRRSVDRRTACHADSMRKEGS